MESYKKIFIHVGLPKTASTLLQEVVFPAVSNATFISRPYTQENQAFNKLQYADETLYTVEELQEQINEILNLEPSEKVILSDELFSGAPFYNFLNRTLIAKRLAAVLPNAEIILFLRGQKEIIRSLYNQYVKIGWLTEGLNAHFISRPGKGFELSDFVKGKRDWNISRRFINPRSLMNQSHFLFYELVKLYEDNFRKLHLFLYEDWSMQPELILTRLEEVFGTKFPPSLLQLIKITDVNPKLTEDRLRTQLLRNRLKVVAQGRTYKILRKSLLPVLALTLKRTGFSQRGEEHLSRAVNPEVLRQNNLKLLEKYPELRITSYPESYFLNQSTPTARCLTDDKRALNREA